MAEMGITEIRTHHFHRGKCALLYVDVHINGRITLRKWGSNCMKKLQIVQFVINVI